MRVKPRARKCERTLLIHAFGVDSMFLCRQVFAGKPHVVVCHADLVPFYTWGHYVVLFIAVVWLISCFEATVQEYLSDLLTGWVENVWNEGISSMRAE